MARDGAPGRLDLARGDALGLHGLQAEGAEIERRAALGEAVDAALVRLAVLGALRVESMFVFLVALALSAPAPARRRACPAPSGRAP